MQINRGILTLSYAEAIIATLNNMKLAPPSPLLAVPNITAHPSTACVPITVLLYNAPLLCVSNMATKGLKINNVASL